MLRVKNLEKSLDFYVRILGMKILRQNDYPQGRFTNTFVGYQGEDEGPTLELTYNWDQQENYDRGNGWGHLALKVSDVYATSEYLKKPRCGVYQRAVPHEAWHPGAGLYQGPGRISH